MIWVTVDDVVTLHEQIIARTGGLAGMRDCAVLESAIAAPLQSFF